MNKLLMKAAMARNDDTQEELAKVLNIQTSGISARINGKVDFRASEIKTIIKRYHLSPEETTDIFFNEFAS